MHSFSKLILSSFFPQPIGALNPKRAAFYAERYETWDDDSTPPHHYTTLYSTSHSTLMWMLRIVSFFNFTLLFNIYRGQRTSHKLDFLSLVPAGAIHHIFPQRQRQQVWSSRESFLWDRPLVEELPEGHSWCQGNSNQPGIIQYWNPKKISLV